jgi:hypothetical protein
MADIFAMGISPSIFHLADTLNAIDFFGHQAARV